MPHAESTNRLVFVLPHIQILGAGATGPFVLGKAEFWPDSEETWSSQLGRTRPTWLDQFKSFPATEGSTPAPARGTLLLSGDDVWLNERVNYVVAIAYFLGAEDTQFRVPAEAFQYYRTSSGISDQAHAVLYTKTRTICETWIDIHPPIELRAAQRRFRIEVDSDCYTEFNRRLNSDQNDRLAIAAFHLFRTQFDNDFVAPPSQDYAAFCACLEAVFDIQGNYANQLSSKLAEFYFDRRVPIWEEDFATWIKGLYSERSVFAHGAVAPSECEVTDDRARAMHDFRSYAANWNLVRWICHDTLRNELMKAAGIVCEFRRSNEESRRLISFHFDSERLWKWLEHRCCQQGSVVTIMSLNESEFAVFADEAGAFLNGFHWIQIRHQISPARVRKCLRVLSSLILRTAHSDKDRESAVLLRESVESEDDRAMERWYYANCGWDGYLPVWESLSFASRALAARAASYYVR